MPSRPRAEVPRGTARAWAAFGHLREAELRLEEQARTHRLKAHLSRSLRLVNATEAGRS